MGSKGFWAFFSSVIKKVPLSEFQGKPVFIDTMLYIYKFIIGIRNSGSDIKLKNGNSVTHLYAIYNLVKNYINQNMLPIFIFDGYSPEIKKKEIEKRRVDINKAVEKLQTLTEDDNKTEYIKNFKRSFTINADIINECKMFLDLMGIPYYTACEEADSQCAALAHYYYNFTCGVVSEDSDVMIFGAPQLIRDIDFKSLTPYCNIIYLDDIMTYLQNKTNEIRKEMYLDDIVFRRANFIDFTIIMGNDYNYGIRCAGGNNRELLFKLFVINDLKIENFIAYLYNVNKKLNKIKFYIPENFIDKILEARENYKYANVYEPNKISISMNKPDLNKLKEMLNSNEFTSNQINFLIKNLNTMYQMTNQKSKINKIIIKDDAGWTLVTKNN